MSNSILGNNFKINWKLISINMYICIIKWSDLRPRTVTGAGVNILVILTLSSNSWTKMRHKILTHFKKLIDITYMLTILKTVYIDSSQNKSIFD